VRLTPAHTDRLAPGLITPASTDTLRIQAIVGRARDTGPAPAGRSSPRGHPGGRHGRNKGTDQGS